MTQERRVVVIGSGPAGSSAARELVNQKIPVTMLEASESFQGGALVRIGGKNLYRRTPPLQVEEHHVVTGDPKTQWYTNQALGGLSNCWTGAVPRFAAEDFTEGERLHERYRWPVTYSELLPYYQQVERLLCISGDPQDAPQLPAGCVTYAQRLPEDWQVVARTAQQYGQGFTTIPLADGPPTMLVRRGTAFNSYVSIVQPLLASPYFDFRAGAQVLHLTWSPVKGKVDGVVYHDRHTGKTIQLSADAIVIACGALNSVKLLFASTSPTFPEGLGNANGLLGRFLHDHPREWWTLEADRPLSLLAPPAYLTRLPYASSQPLMAASWTLGIATVKDRIRSRFGAKGTKIGVQIFGTMVPAETCFARPFPQKKDEWGLPGLELCIHFSEAEKDNIVRARQHLLSIMEESGYNVTIGDIDPTLFPGTAVHYGGTARMHDKPDYGVLDAWNRVYGAPNVLVCDASCFTTAVEKNPTLTVMALASRAAAHLAHDLKHA